MSGPAIQVEGLQSFRKALRTLDDPKAWSRELSTLNRTLAKKAAGWAQAEARRMGGMQARFAKRIAGRATATEMRLEISKKEANPAFWGALKRTGWFAAGRYRGLPSQHPPWVGASWRVATKGEGPYALNTALAEHLDDIETEYGQLIDDLAARAFPD